MEFSKDPVPAEEARQFRDDLSFLAGLTEASVEASRVRPGERIGSRPANGGSTVLIRPGGRNCYPAVWTQDFSMTLDSGFVTDREASDHLRLVASAQGGPKGRRLASGAEVPPFAIPDHVLFDGSPVFYPGTYSSGDDQGGEPWGLRPPSNNHYDFIAIAHHLWIRRGDAGFLREIGGGLSLWERLKRAFAVPEIDPNTGLVATTAESRAVGFIFCDSIYMTGTLLFASLLRRRAALQMAGLAVAMEEDAGEWEKIARRIEAHLPGPFSDPERIGGWLRAATEVGRQPDVWGTIYALYQRALPDEAAGAALGEIVNAVREGTILHRGAVRHVPTDHDASPLSPWERTPTHRNRYQNGAYWHTPTGWLVAVLWAAHRSMALGIVREMAAALREEDFRKGPAFGAPWECLGPEPEAAQNAVFLASVTLPFGILKNLDPDSP